MADNDNNDAVACASCGDTLDTSEDDGFCTSCSWLVLTARKGDIHGHAAHLGCR